MSDRERELRTIIAHPFFALAREFRWDDRQLAAARKLIDITVIRVEELQSAALASPQGAPACSGEPVADGNGLGADGVIYPGDPAHCRACAEGAPPAPEPEKKNCGEFRDGSCVREAGHFGMHRNRTGYTWLSPPTSDTET